MRLWTSALALVVAASGTAYAQQPSPTGEPMPPDVAPAPMPAPDPAPAPAPAPVAAPAVAPAPVAPATDVREYRPREISVAIGLGYVLPTSIQTPNVTSVRLRLPSGLTFEPQLILANTSQEVDVGPSVTDEQSELGIGVLARLPVVKHGRVDLEVLGGLNLNQQSTKPEADDSDISVSTVTAVYGFAVSAWINRHWQVSFSALNPIVSTTTRDEEMGPGASTVTTNTTFGLIFDPTVAVMLHLYH